MCGRFSLVDTAELYKRFQIESQEAYLIPRYNIAPSQDIVVIVNMDNRRQLAMFKWGLIPSWAKDPTIGRKIINARSETLDIKPSFKHPFKKKRCLIPADGFYEWKKDGKTKKPYRITLKNGETFAFAGLWDSWISPTGEVVNSCTIITTTPNALIEPLHNRMPVILSKENEETWIDQKLTDTQALKSLLIPYPASLMTLYEVSGVVNSPKTDDERCIAKLE